jgi:MFS family permease
VGRLVTTDRLYDRLFDENGDTRVDRDVPEAARAAIPRNFFIQLAARISTKLGDALSGPRLVLPWLLAAVGTPTWLIAALVPIREAGSLLPQILIGGIVQRVEIRKWFWVAGSIAQGCAVLGIAAAGATLGGEAAGWITLALLALFSLARGICSVTSKDLVGKTVPKTRRGRLSGLADSGAGLLTLLVGGVLVVTGGENLPVAVFVGLLVVAGGLWLLAAALMSRLGETPSRTARGDGTLRVVMESLHLVRTDGHFRRFLVARALLASTVLSMPFYVLLARRATSGSGTTFGLFLVAGSLAASVSAYVWGSLADRSSRMTLVIAGGSAGIIGIVTFLYAGMGQRDGWAVWIYGSLYFLLSLAHTGIRLGRKTHVVDMATSETRAAYVAVGNTLIGVLLLVSGSLGVLTTIFSERAIVLVFGVLGVLGATAALRLGEVQTR